MDVASVPKIASEYQANESKWDKKTEQNDTNKQTAKKCHEFELLCA